MTPEQKKEVVKIGQKLQKVFSGIFGSIKFNFAPKRKSVNINYEESIIVEPDKQAERK